MNNRDARPQARRLLGSGQLSLAVLWLHYWGQGGSGGLWELDAYIHEALALDDQENALLGWALEAIALR
jgi:hypothetical protein